MKCAVYLIKSLKDDRFYTGISADPKKRLKEHNSGKLRTTSFRKPFQLVWYKFYDSTNLARQHEKWLKKKGAAYKEKLTTVAQLAPPMQAG